MKRCLAAVSLASLLVAGCQLPNQNAIPPSIRLTYTSGVMSPSLGPPNGGPAMIHPNQPVSIFADGFSSLSGMKRLELDTSLNLVCRLGADGIQESPTFAAIVKTAPSGPIATLRLSAELDLGRPASYSSYCPSGATLAQWSATFTVNATSWNGWNGLSATSQSLNLQI
jgi:hypothetical protein